MYFGSVDDLISAEAADGDGPYVPLSVGVDAGVAHVEDIGEFATGNGIIAGGPFLLVHPVGVALLLGLQADALQPGGVLVVVRDVDMEERSGGNVQGVLLDLDGHVATRLLEVCGEGEGGFNSGIVGGGVTLADAGYAELDALVVVDIGVGLQDLYGLLQGLSGGHEDGASVGDVVSVHKDSGTVDVRCVDHIDVEPAVAIGFADVVDIDGEVGGLSAGHSREGGHLGGELRHFHLHGLFLKHVVAFGLIIFSLYKVLVGAAGLSATGVEDGAEAVGGSEHVDGEGVVAIFHEGVPYFHGVLLGGAVAGDYGTSDLGAAGDADSRAVDCKAGVDARSDYNLGVARHGEVLGAGGEGGRFEAATAVERIVAAQVSVTFSDGLHLCLFVVCEHLFPCTDLCVEPGDGVAELVAIFQVLGEDHLVRRSFEGVGLCSQVLPHLFVAVARSEAFVVRTDAGDVDRLVGVVDEAVVFRIGGAIVDAGVAEVYEVRQEGVLHLELRVHELRTEAGAEGHDVVQSKYGFGILGGHGDANLA